MWRASGLVLTVVSCVALTGCVAVTEPASNVGSMSATLNAQGRTGSRRAHYEFQYATSQSDLGTSLGSETPTRGPVPRHVHGPGGALVPFSETVSGLSPGTTYFFRVCGGNGPPGRRRAHPDRCARTRSFTTTVPGVPVAFAPPVSYPVHSTPAAVAIADLQGPGSNDLVTANPATNDVSVLLNEGAGTFAPAVNYPTGAGPRAVAVGDLIGHGDRDVVTTSTGASISVLLGRGDGTLGKAVSYALPGPAQSVVVGDFNGDGHQDIAAFEIAGTTGDAEVSVLPGRGDGSFGAPINTTVMTAGQKGVPYFTPLTGTLVAGRFDDTGHLDLAVDGAYHVTIQGGPQLDLGYLSVLLNDGTGMFSVDDVSPGSGNGVEVESLSGLAAGLLNNTPAPLSLFYVDNEAATGAAVYASLLWRQPGNGEGAADLLAALVGPSPTPTTPLSSVTVLVAHLSSSVNNDVAVGDVQQGVTVLPGNGDGTFKSPVAVTGIGSALGIASGDLNGDGKTDLAVAGPNNQPEVSVLFNASDGY